MRIAIISAPAQRRGVPDYVKTLAKGMEAMGHRVDVMDAWTEDGFRLPGYEYIVAVAESVSLFGGKMPEALPKVLSSGSGLVGKKGAAFLRKTGPFTGKAMYNLMRAMEHEGMVVNWSDVILSAPHAEILGKRIGA
ncbi:MAG: hypothetical protein LBH70_08205 [Spirochaetaceae bacterium]|jgi:hypothetical protein|nr:hypothetical protein [Spirochaetaceae bacterium]